MFRASCAGGSPPQAVTATFWVGWRRRPQQGGTRRHEAVHQARRSHDHDAIDRAAREIVAVRADSGGLAWSDSLASARGRTSLLDLSAIRAAPVVDRGRVHAVGVGGLLVALDLRSGRRLWEREAGGGETPAVAGEWLFVLTSEQTLAAVGREDGRVRWTRDLPRYGDARRQRDPIAWTGPLLANSRLLLGGSNEQMVAVDAATGEMASTQRLRDSVSVPPLAAAGTVLLLTDGGTLQAFR